MKIVTRDKRQHFQCLPATSVARGADRQERLISGEALWRPLGYQNAQAFNRSARLGTVPIPLHELPGRRGRFALESELNAWIESLRTKASENIDQD
jgi:hypothetical protein